MKSGGDFLKKTLFADIFPFWDTLSDAEKDSFITKSIDAAYHKGQHIHHSEMKCKGIIIVLSGMMRIYMVSEEGREITLFYIYAGDSCVLSASCLLETIAFEIIIEAVGEVHAVIVPTTVLLPIIDSNPSVELFLYKKASERFSDVMWTFQQILFMSTDKRIAVFLWDEMLRQNQQELKITHDEIAKNIGSAREVVTKTLKCFAKEGILLLGRGKITITDKSKLQNYI